MTTPAEQEPRIDPVMAAINVGEILTYPRTVGETAGDIQEVLVRMGCNLERSRVGDRFQIVADRYGDQALVVGSMGFDALTRATAEAIMRRSNGDLMRADAVDRGDDNAAATVKLLDAFMSAASTGGQHKGYIERLVVREAKHQRVQHVGKTSYYAVGAVRYYNHILDSLRPHHPMERLVRAMRSFRSRLLLGGDVYDDEKYKPAHDDRSRF